MALSYLPHPYFLLTEKANRVKQDKNIRPYAISIDWLQLYCWNSGGFNPEYDTMTHHFADIGHGSKVFRKIYNVVDADGCLIGNISLDPYSDAINKNTVIFKAENNILYEPDAIPRIFAFLAEAGLHYKGITRIDVAYDCNEFYGGLKPQKLLDNYFNMRYLKLGNNDPWVKMSGGYKLKFRANNSQKIKLDGDGQTVGAFRASSVTWGQRSSDIQVQVYNKSKELREVKMKHHIVDWWKQNGLETEESDVYRVEIRITNAKTLKNSTNGKLFKLQASDLLLQEQIENLFAAFASKYFRFYHRRDISHLERMPEVKIFCHGKKPVLKPLHVRGRKDYTRQTKITLNWLDKQIYANAKEDNVFTHSLLDVKKYLETVYQMGQYVKEKDEKLREEKGITERPENYRSLMEYYAELYAGMDDDLCEQAAKARAEYEKAIVPDEKEIEHLKGLLDYEEADPSRRWEPEITAASYYHSVWYMRKRTEDYRRAHKAGHWKEEDIQEFLKEERRKKDGSNKDKG